MAKRLIQKGFSLMGESYQKEMMGPLDEMNELLKDILISPCSRRQFGLLGPSLLEVDFDERPEEGTLASTLAVIERIHKIFFSHTSLDEADTAEQFGAVCTTQADEHITHVVTNSLGTDKVNWALSKVINRVRVQGGSISVSVPREQTKAILPSNLKYQNAFPAC
ncbi:RNA polymerase II C-terminal domain phosphatase-like 3 [Raphanus sativus]|nr:RNA polymerase II C-terminal domain phosphatase-like 3 [Raphanus sativus]